LKQPATLVFDIGKTTKKALVFDVHSEVLEEKTEHFTETTDDDNFHSENLSLVSDWVRNIVNDYLHHPKYDIKDLNFSAYGASLVHLDENDKALAPFYNYLKPMSDDVKEKFLSAYNKDENLMAATASPFLGLLNSGLQLYWLKHRKKEFFNRIKTSLHFPQYFPFLLTGHKATELTSIGCHTMLWDFTSMKYHKWVTIENLIDFFPALKSTSHVFDCQLHGKTLRVGTGVHDSSAALMPYLVTMKDPFLLMSTGTWNITFNPFNNEGLSTSELEKDCLCYMTYDGKPVKASRIFLGHEHETQKDLLSDYFSVSRDFYKSIKFNDRLFKALENDNDPQKAFYPVAMMGTGPLPEPATQITNNGAFENFEQAYHQLVRYLIRWQKLSIDLVDPLKQIKNIIVVGGFTKSPIFLSTLARKLNDRNVLISDHPRASALGACWLVKGKSLYEGRQQLLNVSRVS
jgi:L-fuculokinase